MRVHVDQNCFRRIFFYFLPHLAKAPVYLDTAAIDGENKSQTKKVFHHVFFDVDKPEEISFELQCDPPNDDIYRFNGRIILSSGDNIHSCDNNNILLRGCVLRITDYIDGIIVYAGKRNDT